MSLQHYINVSVSEICKVTKCKISIQKHGSFSVRIWLLEGVRLIYILSAALKEKVTITFSDRFDFDIRNVDFHTLLA